MKVQGHKYVIVGAGIAGLQAAAILAENSQDFIILQASDRYGGRIFSRRLGDILKEDNINANFSWVNEKVRDANIEYGATWIADEHTFVLEILKNYGMKAYEQFWDGKMTLALGKGNLVEYNHLEQYYLKLHGPKVKGMLETMKGLREKISYLLQQQKKGCNKSTQELKKLVSWLDSTTAYDFILDNVRNKQLADVLASESVSLQCVNLTQFSALQLLANDESSLINVKYYVGFREGNVDGYRISGGTSGLIRALYSRLVNALKGQNKKIEDILRLNQPVTEVLNHLSPVKIMTKGRKVYACQTVIMAVPMATAGRIRFSQISSSKKLAIDNQLYCNMTRMPVVFATPWWRSYHSGYALFVPEEFQMVEMIDISPESLSCGVLAFVFTADGYQRWMKAIMKECTGLTGKQLENKVYAVNLRKSLDVIADILLKGDRNSPLLKESFAFAKTLSVYPYIRSTYEASTAPFIGARITNMKQNYLEAEQSDEKNIIFIGADFTPQHCGYMEGALRVTHKKIGALVAQVKPNQSNVPRSMI